MNKAPQFKPAPPHIATLDEIKVSVFSGPVSNTTIKRDVGWSELVEILTDEPEGLRAATSEEKSKGGYFVRGLIDGKRNDENLGDCHLVFLDIDKPIDGHPLPTPQDIHNALSDHAHAVHNTATPDRCRIVLPVAPYAKEDTQRITEAAYHFCRSRGLNFALSNESRTKSQAFFLPQTTDFEAHQAFANKDGNLFDYESIDFDMEQEPAQEKEPVYHEEKNGHNHLKRFIDELKSGTIHQAAKEYAGWQHRVSNLTTRQIFDDLTTLIDLHCSDHQKVTRWHNSERVELEKWFRGNVGTSGGTDPSTEIDIDTPEWPELSPLALPGAVGEFVDLSTQNSEADPAAVLATFLVYAGVEMGPGPRIMVGDTPHHCRLAAAIVGDSSKARKGTSAKPVRRFFTNPPGQEPSSNDGNLDGMINPAPAQYSSGPFSSGEGIIHLVRDPVRKYDQKLGEYVVEDPGAEDKRLMVIDEEFAGVLAHTKREGNTLSMIIRQMWDSGDLAPITKSNRTIATGAHIGWVSHITLFELNTRLDNTEAFNGFANRILWVCARRPKLVPWPQPMDDRELHRLQRGIFKHIKFVREEYTLKPNKETMEAWSNKYYLSLSSPKPGLLGSVISRAEAQVLRLAMIYTILDGKQAIDLPHLESAIAFWTYCEQSAAYIFHGKQGDKVVQKILEALKKGPMTGTEVHRLFGSHVSKKRLEQALAELISAGKIKQQKETTGGRPTTRYELSSNP